MQFDIFGDPGPGNAIEASMAFVQQVINEATRMLFVPLGAPAEPSPVTVRYEGIVRRIVITQPID